VIKIINRKQPIYGTYNFSNADSCSWYEFALAIYDRAKARGLLNKDVNIMPVDTSAFPLPAARPAYSLLIKDKIKREFGVTVRSWNDALGDFMSSAEFTKKAAAILSSQKGSSASAEQSSFTSAKSALPSSAGSADSHHPPGRLQHFRGACNTPSGRVADKEGLDSEIK